MFDLFHTFSICFDVIKWSLELALTISLYERSDFSFFSWAPESLIQICGRNEWGIPSLTMLFSLSDLGNLDSTCDKNNQHLLFKRILYDA